MILRLLSILRAAIIEPFVLVFCLLIYFFRLRNPPYRATDSEPIILIHGYLHNSSGWLWQRYRLSKMGFGPIYVINLDWLHSSMQEHAAKVEHLIDEIRAETGARRVQLVGHSMGGLVATWVASYRPHHVAKVITIGSPMEGTYLGILGFGVCGQQMRRGAPFLKELCKHAETLTMVPFIHIASDADEIVIPNRSAVPGFTPDAKRIWVDGLGHLSLLFSNRITKILASELSHP